MEEIKNIASEVYPKGGRAKINGFFSFRGTSGEVVQGDRRFVESYKNICEEDAAKREKWVAELRGKGIKAAHEDDGWHNREEKYFSFCYPHFDDGIEVGDSVALGDYGGYKIFRAKRIRKGLFGLTYYHY